MAGSIYLGYGNSSHPSKEYYIVDDISAAQMVFNSSWVYINKFNLNFIIPLITFFFKLLKVDDDPFLFSFNFYFLCSRYLKFDRCAYLRTRKKYTTYMLSTTNIKQQVALFACFAMNRS